MKKIPNNRAKFSLISIFSKSIIIILFILNYAFASTSKQMVVYKDPYCGCCEAWIKYMHKSGFNNIKVVNTNDIISIKEKYSIPPKYQSCHTLITPKGFIFEGHVPAKYINNFLKDSPKESIGLSVPGMPASAPGMDGGQKFVSYKVYQLQKNNKEKIFASILTR